MTEGSIVTFYSYKGGVGRTLALANIGALLSLWGYKVLCVDWDLEAPGLHYYYKSWIKSTTVPGLLELIQAHVDNEEPDWQNFITEVVFPGSSEPLYLIKAGIQNNTYTPRLKDLNWQYLYDEQDLGLFIEQLRNDWKRTFDLILIDSRTGITDIGGICTIQLPDILAVCFTTNEQSFYGVISTVDRIIKNRNQFPFDRAKLLILPTLTRFDVTKPEKCKEVLKVFSKKLEPLYYEDWIHSSIRAIDLLNKTVIPYSPEWSFWEDLPVVREGTELPQSIGYAFEANAALIANKLAGSELLVNNRDSFVAEHKVMSNIKVVQQSDFSRDEENQVIERPKMMVEQPSSTDRDWHYQRVIRAICRGSLVPFLGSGINLCDRQYKDINPEMWKIEGSDPPTHRELSIHLLRNLGLNLELKNYLSRVTLPSYITDKLKNESSFWIEALISAYQTLSFPEYGNWASLTLGQRELQKTLNQISTHLYTPNKFHNFFAQLPATLSQKGYQTSLRLIVTANFDSTLENAFKSNGQEFDLVYYVGSAKKFFHRQWRKDYKGYILENDRGFIDAPNTYALLDPDKYPVILKLYGPMGGTGNLQDDFVITEDHFINYLAQSNISRLLPASLLEVLHNSNILFLGYGLSHWDERVVLHRLWPKETFPIEKQKCWAIQLEPRALDRELWRQAGVEPICTSLEDYITELKQRVEDLPAR